MCSQKIKTQKICFGFCSFRDILYAAKNSLPDTLVQVAGNLINKLANGQN